MKMHFLYPSKRKPTLNSLLAGEFDQNWYGYNAFSKKYHVSSIWDFQANNRFLKYINELARKVFYLNSNPGVGFSFLSALANRRAANKSDFCFAVNDTIAYSSLMLKKYGLINKPIIVQLIGTSQIFYQNKLAKTKENKILSRISNLLNFAEAIISFVPSEYETISDRLSVPEKKIFNLNTLVGWERKYIKEVKANEQGNYILSIGADNNRDFNLLIQAAAETKYKYILIVSSNHCFTSPIPNNISVYYDLPLYLVTKFINNCKFAVFPIKENLYTAAFRAVLQTMMLSKPALISDVSALRCFPEFKHGETCYKTKAHCKKSLVEALNTLYSDTEICNKIGQNGQELAVNSFTQEKYVDKLSNVFNEVFKV